MTSNKALNWTDLRIRSRAHIKEHPNLPEGIRGPAMQLTGIAVGLASQIVGNLELVYRRGYDEGYKAGQKVGFKNT